MDPSLRKRMKEGKVFWNRHQTHYDHTIFKICQALYKKGEVKTVFVDKHHITTIIKSQGDPAVAVLDKESLPGMFHQKAAVLEVLAAYRVAFDDADAEDEAEAMAYDATADTTAAPEEPVEMKSAKNSRIIDAEDTDDE